MSPIKKICVECGAGFLASGRGMQTSLYCSPWCRKAGRNKQISAHKREKYATDSAYVERSRRSGRRTYERHKDRWNAARRVKHKKPWRAKQGRACVVCGEQFTPTNARKICCSKECARARALPFVRRNRARWLERHPDYRKSSRFRKRRREMHRRRTEAQKARRRALGLTDEQRLRRNALARARYAERMKSPTYRVKKQAEWRRLYRQLSLEKRQAIAKRHAKRKHEWFKRRYRTDIEFREHYRAVARTRKRELAKNPEVRARLNDQRRQRLALLLLVEPQGEKQWLRRNQVELRRLKRLLRKPREAFLSPNPVSATPNSSPP